MDRRTLTLDEFKEIDSCETAMEMLKTIPIEDQKEYFNARLDYMFYTKYRPDLKKWK